MVEWFVISNPCDPGEIMTDEVDFLEGVVDDWWGRLVLLIKNGRNVRSYPLGDELLAEFDIRVGDSLVFRRVGWASEIQSGLGVFLLPKKIASVWRDSLAWRDYWNDQISNSRHDIFPGYAFRVYHKVNHMKRGMSRTEIQLRVGCDVPDTYGFSFMRGILNGGNGRETLEVRKSVDWNCVVKIDVERIIRELEEGFKCELAYFECEGWNLDDYRVMCDNLVGIMWDLGVGYEKLRVIEESEAKLSQWDEILSRPEWVSAIAGLMNNRPVRLTTVKPGDLVDDRWPSIEGNLYRMPPRWLTQDNPAGTDDVDTD